VRYCSDFWIEPLFACQTIRKESAIQAFNNDTLCVIGILPLKSVSQAHWLDKAFRDTETASNE